MLSVCIILPYAFYYIPLKSERQVSEAVIEFFKYLIFLFSF